MKCLNLWGYELATNCSTRKSAAALFSRHNLSHDLEPQVSSSEAFSHVYVILSAGAMLLKTKLTLLHITARYNEAGVFHVHTSTLPLPHFEVPNQAKKTLAQQLLNQKKAAKALRHPL